MDNQTTAKKLGIVIAGLLAFLVPNEIVKIIAAVVFVVLLVL